MKTFVRLQGPRASVEEQRRHLHLPAKRKQEISLLAKFLFENREKILSMKPEAARLWVTKQMGK
jgi:hypothetical protein